MQPPVLRATAPTVLVVGADTVLRLLVARIVRQQRLRIVGQVVDGHDGTALALRLRPDIVVLAVAGLDGLEALPLLRTVLPHADIVAVAPRLSPALVEHLLAHDVTLLVDERELAERLPLVLDRIVARSDPGNV